MKFQTITQINSKGSSRHIDMKASAAAPLKELGFFAAFLTRSLPPYLLERVGNECPDHYLWILTTKGEAKLTTEDGVYALKEGTMLSLPSWIPRRFEITDEYWEQINFTMWADSDNDLCKCKELTARHFHDTPHFDALFNACITEQNAPDPDSEQAINYQCSLMALYLKRAARAIAASDDYELHHRFSKLWMEVNTSLSHSWTVQELAERIFVSPPYLYKLCQKYYKMSPLAYVAKLRMARAADHLISSMDSLVLIANMVGYSSEYAFSTAFKKHYGMRPGAYRKQGRSL